MSAESVLDIISYLKGEYGEIKISCGEKYYYLMTRYTNFCDKFYIRADVF